MDYKKTYLDTYLPLLKKQENKAIELLLKYKSQKRKYNSASSKVGSILLDNLKDYEKDAPFNIHHQALDYSNMKDEFYSEDSLELILQNEIKDIYDEGVDLGTENYKDFIEKLATYKALDDAKRNFGNLNWLVELYFEYDEIHKLSLDYFGDVKEHEDYIRLIERKYPELQKKKNKKVDPIEDNTISEKDKESRKPENKFDRLIEDLHNDEKIIIRHYLLNMPSKKRMELDETEIIKILHISDGVFDHRIFTKKSKDITFVSKYRNGLFYYDKILKRKKLKESILRKTVDLKIDKFREFFEEDN